MILGRPVTPVEPKRVDFARTQLRVVFGQQGAGLCR
jgi:hypothetical protein